MGDVKQRKELQLPLTTCKELKTQTMMDEMHRVKVAFVFLDSVEDFVPS